MRSFFANKINILLSFLLIAAIAVTGLLGYAFLGLNKDVEVPDMLGKNVQEVFEWCGKLDSKYSCELIYEDSKSVEKDIVFQQSSNVGSKLVDKITFKISSGLIKMVDLPQLYNATKVDIEKWQSKYLIENVTYVDEYSDTVTRGTVIRMEPTESIYPDTPITVYVSAGREGLIDPDGNIEVKAGEYIGLNVERFEAQTRSLGLAPNHNSARDMYSSSVSKGNVVWHGSGTYEPGERINYGVSLGEKDGGSADGDIVVKEGQYVGKTEEEFKKIANDLGLKANHDTDRDDYSDTVAKGSVVKHGYGNYEKNETFNYGLSLGKKDGSSEIIVTENQYQGKTEADFRTIASGLGLRATHLTSRDAYSDTIAKGSIVTHGWGTYEKGEDFNYGLSLGNNDGSIIVTQYQYRGKTESEFKTIANELGLKANHDTDRDDYSDSITKGSILTHGYGTYEKNETFNYGLSLGKNGDSTEIIVKQNQYQGKTEAEFKTIAEGLGLIPTHLSSRDAYSDTVAKGNIVTHGYGTYEKNEAFNYGLSLGKSDSSSTSDEFYISKDKYVGKTEAEFKTIAEGLGLKPTHLSDRDAYSDTIVKGSVVTHGYGDYEKGEAFNYGLSLGKKESGSSDTDSIVVTAGKYVGKSESEFVSIASSLGLKANHNSDRDAYSDSIAAGKIVWHGSGTYVKNETFNYGLSLGKAPEQTGKIMRPEKYQVGDTYDSTKSKMQSYLSVFSNVAYEGVSSTKGVGQLEKIEVGSYGSSYSEGDYPIDTPIKVYIVNKQTN